MPEILTPPPARQEKPEWWVRPVEAAPKPEATISSSELTEILFSLVKDRIMTGSKDEAGQETAVCALTDYFFIHPHVEIEVPSDPLAVRLVRQALGRRFVESAAKDTLELGFDELASNAAAHGTLHDPNRPLEVGSFGFTADWNNARHELQLEFRDRGGISLQALNARRDEATSAKNLSSEQRVEVTGDREGGMGSMILDALGIPPRYFELKDPSTGQKVGTLAQVTIPMSSPEEESTTPSGAVA